MRALLRSALLIVALSITGHPAEALDDTKANRLAQAERYVRIANLKRLLTDMFTGTISSAPADKREQATRRLNEILDRANWDHLRAIYVDENP